MLNAMTSDGDALFRAICEQPWEDTPRLIYADWLEENGQPDRAAFIRFQCRFPTDNQFGPDQFAECLPRWRAELGQFRGVDWLDTQFERGFVGWVTFRSPNKFREHAESVFAAAPVDFVCVKSVHERTARHVLRSPLLARIKKLTLNGNLTAKVMREVAGCAYLARLDAMWLCDGMTDEGAALLAAAPHLGRLTDLTILQHKFGAEGVRALARSERLATVTNLYLRPHYFDAELAAELRARFRRSAWLYPPPSGTASTGSS
jgi:uncharacterized protein (TIGR02996 family)